MKDIHKEKDNDRMSHLFDEISPTYDFVNHLLSFGIDKLWRKRLVRIIRRQQDMKIILDVATGTADLAIEASKQIQGISIVAIDISDKMLEEAGEKINNGELDKIIELKNCPAEKISYPDNYFDSVIASFGVRNFENTELGLTEMIRVVKPGRKVFILEFSKPKGILMPLYYLYFRFVVPILGRMISKHYKAYTYFRQSVMQFPDSKSFMRIMKKCGMHSCEQIRLSGGIATIYIGVKKIM